MEALKTVLSRRIALPVVVAAVLLQDVTEAGQYAGLRSQLVNWHSFAETDSTNYSCMVQGKEYSGYVLAELSDVSDAASCQKNCDQHPQCRFFTFVSDKKRCRLQVRQPSEVRDNSNAFSGPKRCPVCVIEGYDFKGQPNINNNGVPGVTTLAACQVACQAEPRCYGFLFNSNSKTCFFKKGKMYVSALVPDSKYIAGPKTCANERWCVMSGIQFNGGDKRTLKTKSAAACQDECLNDGDCDYFSWIESSNECLLKAGSAVGAAKMTKSGVHSGPKHCGLPTTCIKEQTKYVDDTIATYPKTEVGSFAACQRRCWKTGNCFFMHFNDEGCTLSGINATEVADANSKGGDVTC
ncbi:hypothetical protein NCLIV_038110 [Neospora caninum Liverpool]|uniref:Micronemal protein 4 n=2 Tax=Neospora caninum TaxID=29176 RepID=F0VJW8_NEOCL|nr:hypothetical protein NCLIV_038110 [Neospora caninum Liverpool]AKP20157.1 microneme protein 17 B [Neospora caninum]CBZ54030.1 hypothetical protein NCLIV_038110 [Neospora caninum Liverpool]CEL68034.1 TPA: Micronemal protein 4 [Neospora caninum Liverpool]|eukprot:XP_003884061.1 hypothetical protein NCLIV_038110 [Neospora caninum Liverpool]